MEKTKWRGSLRVTLFLFAVCSGISWAQNPLKFEDYLKQNQTVYANFQSLQEYFKKVDGTDALVEDAIRWHKELVQDKMIEPMQKLLWALKDSSANFSAKQEFKNALTKFIELCKTSFTKDDAFRKELGDDKLAAYLIWAAAFLSTEDASYTMYLQDQKKSYRIGSVVLNFYTGSLCDVVYMNKRDDASLGEYFQNQTAILVQWVDKTPVESRK